MKSLSSTHVSATSSLLIVAAALLFLSDCAFAQALSFAKASNYTVGTTPVSVAVGDFDGDGNQDMATANVLSNDISILLGDGLGGFTEEPTSSPIPLITGNCSAATCPNPVHVVVGHFNGDTNLDLAVANFGNPPDNLGNVAILLGNGDGTFGAATDITVGSGPIFIAVADFNGDTALDLAVANHSSDSVSILIGNDDGTFDDAVNFTVGNQPVSIAVGDFSTPADGNLDLAVANFVDDTVSILLNNGAGSFSPPTLPTPATISVQNQPVSVVAGDFNGDGDLDLAVVNQLSKSISVLLRTGDGAFDDVKKLRVVKSPVQLVAGDFNGDSALDLALVYFPGHNGSVYPGKGDGTFGKAKAFKSSGPASGNFAVAVGNFDTDVNNKPDLAVANGTISILLNNTTFPDPGANIVVTSPNGGEPVPVGTQTITWTSAGFLGNVRIDLQREPSENWKTIVKSTPNIGSRAWKVTAPVTTGATALIRICSVSYPGICDQSDGAFTITIAP